MCVCVCEIPKNSDFHPVFVHALDPHISISSLVPEQSRALRANQQHNNKLLDSMHLEKKRVCMCVFVFIVSYKMCFNMHSFR